MGWPVFQSLYPQPFMAFAAICVNAGTESRYRFTTSVIERTLLHDAMNQMCAGMLQQTQCQALIVFDDDCRPPTNVVPRLMRHFEAGKDFVAGVGFMRNYPHTTTVGRYYPEGISLTDTGKPQLEARGFQWLDEIDHLPPLADVSFCGFPVAMITRRMLEAIPYPWFATQDEDGGACTHDVYFCKKAKKHGFPILVDTTIQCDHLGAAPWVTFDNRRVIRSMHGKTVNELVGKA